MRAESAMPRGAEGVHPESEALWRRLEAEVGLGFSHNMFVEGARRHGVGREKARRDYRTLRERNGHAPQEEARVNTSTTQEQTSPVPVPVLAEAPELAALRRTVQAQAQEVRELRALVQRTPMSASDMPQRLAKLEAQQASLWGAVQGLEEQLRGVETAVRSLLPLAQVLTYVQENPAVKDMLIRMAQQHAVDVTDRGHVAVLCDTLHVKRPHNLTLQ